MHHLRSRTGRRKSITGLAVYIELNFFMMFLARLSVETRVPYPITRLGGLFPLFVMLAAGSLVGKAVREGCSRPLAVLLGLLAAYLSYYYLMGAAGSTIILPFHLLLFAGYAWVSESPAQRKRRTVGK